MTGVVLLVAATAYLTGWWSHWQYRAAEADRVAAQWRARTTPAARSHCRPIYTTRPYDQEREQAL